MFASEMSDHKSDDDWWFLYRHGFIRYQDDENVLNHISDYLNAHILWDK